MNEGHLQFLSSPEWAEMLESDLFPWVLSTVNLGDDVLEVGPGPGLTTDILRRHARKVTAVEVDPDLATALAGRLAGTNVEVLSADAAVSGLPSERFSSAACFSMLHHVPSAAEQDKVFAEIARVLRPGATFVGCDALDSEALREYHADDVFVPLDPDTLGSRLQKAGLDDLATENFGGYELRFRAKKPL